MKDGPVRIHVLTQARQLESSVVWLCVVEKNLHRNPAYLLYKALIHYSIVSSQAGLSPAPGSARKTAVNDHPIKSCELSSPISAHDYFSITTLPTGEDMLELSKRKYR